MTTPLPATPAPDYQPVATIDRTQAELTTALGIEFAPAIKEEFGTWAYSSEFRLKTYTYKFRQQMHGVELGIEVLLDLNDDFNGRDNSVYRLFERLGIEDKEVFYLRKGYVPREYAHLH